MTRILKINIKGLSNFHNNEFNVDFTNLKNASDNNGELTNVISSLYTHNVMAFTGPNASGKTMTLRLINWVLNFIHNNNNNLDELELIANFSDDVILSYYFKTNFKINELSIAENDNIVVVKSVITIKRNYDGRLEIFNEEIYIKNPTYYSTKNTIMDFTKYNEKITKDQFISNYTKPNSNMFADFYIDEFVKNKSITHYMFFNKRDNIKFFEANDIKLNKIKTIDPVVLSYLDSSIESLTPVKESNANSLYILKFYGQDEILIHLTDVLKYMSMGTVKGLVLYDAIKETLSNGGYLIIDELEISFHKSVTTDIIKLFNSYTTNPNGAVLIFTTHYAEVLNVIRRTDAIYITSKTNENKLLISSLSEFEPRNDKLKSDAFFNLKTDINSKPSYDKYQEVLKSIIERIKWLIYKNT